MFGNFTPANLLTNAIVLLVAMAVHEYAHTRVAYAWGDDTAKRMGRMTLDPRANINLPGFIIGVLIGFAILGSAPVNPSRMRDPRWGYFWAVIAGPISNLLVAVVFALPVRLGLLSLTGSPGSDIIPSPNYVVTQMIFLNLLLFFFNLLPLSPLDGWSVVFAALPPGPSIWWQRQREYTMYALFAFVGLSFVVPQFSPLTFLIAVPSQTLLFLLAGV